MFIIGIVIFLALLAGVAFLSGAPLIYLDLPSLAVILTLSLAVLLISGLLGDFFKGFKLMTQKENIYSSIELKRIGEALKLSIRTVLLSGVFGTLTGLIGSLSNLSDPASIPQSFGAAALTLLYAIVLTFILLPVQAKAKAVLATLE